MTRAERQRRYALLEYVKASQALHRAAFPVYEDEEVVNLEAAVAFIEAGLRYEKQSREVALQELVDMAQEDGDY